MAHLSSVPDDPTDFEAWLHSLPPDQAHQIARQLDQAGLLAAESGPPEPDMNFAFQPNAPIDVPEPPDSPSRLSVMVSLVDAKPAVWRQLAVPGDVTLETLHDAIQLAMGWTNSHLHRFWPTHDPSTNFFITEFDSFEGEEGTPESQVRVDQLLRTPQDAIRYEYDFGDSWEHVITLKSVEPGDGTAIMCTDGAGACPPEDVGGIGFYNEVAEWLRNDARGAPPGGMATDDAIALMSWLPRHFDPDAFDCEHTTNALGALTCAPASERLTIPDELVQIIDDLPRSTRHIVNGWLVDDAWSEPIYLDADTARQLLRPWLTVLEIIGDGTELTKAGWLKPALVSQIFTALDLGETWIGKGNREDLTPPVADLREQCQHLGLLSKRKGRLQPTARARKFTEDPVAMFWHIADRIPVDRTEFERRSSWLYLVGYGSGIGFGLERHVAMLMSTLGWRTTEGPVDETDVFHGTSSTSQIVENLAYARVGKPPLMRDSGWTRDGAVLARAAILGRS